MAASRKRKRKGTTHRAALPRDETEPLDEHPRGPATRALLWSVMVLLGVFGLVHGHREISSPDIGFHLATARWILEHGRFPATDPFTYTLPDRPYIDLQWLFQLLVHAAETLHGPAGIIAVTTALTLLFAAVLVVRTRQRNGCVPISSAALLALFLLGTLWEPRPHLLSWTWGSVVLFVLGAHARGDRRWLWALPAVLVVWVNTHSLFVLGLVIIAVYVGCHLLDVVRSGRGWQGLDRSLLVWSSAALSACLLNPYHIHGLLFPLVQLQIIQGDGALKSPVTGIAEFTSPLGFDAYFVEGHLRLIHPWLFMQAFAALAIFGSIAHWRRTRSYERVLLAAFLYAFWRANKNFGYFVMVAFPIATAGLDRIGAEIRDRLAGTPMRDRSRSDERWALTWLASLAAICLALIGAAGSGRLLDLAWDPSMRRADFASWALPVGASAFIRENGIEGRILNTWDHGGYIAWVTRQPILVYSHAEVTGPGFFAEYVDAKTPQGFADALTRWKPTIAVVPYRVAPYWLYHLRTSRDWRLVYADQYTGVFLHASVSPRLAAISGPRAGVDYPSFDANATARIVEEAVRAGPPTLEQWLRGRTAIPAREIDLSAFYLLTQEIDASIATSLEGLRKSSFAVPELLLNLGHALNFRGEYPLADVCFDAFLRAADDPVAAGEIASARRERR